MVSNANVPSFPMLTPDSRVWRVDWYGGVGANAGAPSDPLVEVIISPLLDERGDPGAQPNIMVADQKLVRIGIGALPYVPIGSLWKDGKKMRGSAGREEYFTKVKIDTETVRICAFRDLMQMGINIPAKYHSIGSGAGKSSSFQARCVCIQYQGDPFGLIIPVLELIRFYYITSSTVAKALFSHPFEDAIYELVSRDKHSYNHETGELYLCLRTKIRDPEAWIIARMLMDGEGRKGAKRIFDSMLQYANSGSSVTYPFTTFPFVGETNITALGKKIPVDDERSRWIYLVWELRSCSAPFPFSSLIIGRENPAYPADPVTDIPDEEKKTYIRPSQGNIAATLVDGSIVVSNEPFSGIDTCCIDAVVNRFGDLKNKKWRRPLDEKNEFKSGGWNAIPPISVSNFSTGNGIGTPNTTGPLDFVFELKSADFTPNVIDSGELVDALQKVPGVEALVRIGENDIAFMPLKNPYRKRSQWAYLDSSTRKRRRMLIIDIFYKKKQFALVDFEWREKEGDGYSLAILYNQYGTEINNPTLRDILWRLAVNEGRWKRVRLPPGIFLLLRKHTWGENSKDAAGKIIDTIDAKMRVTFT